MNTVVQADGIYPNDEGIAFDPGHAVVLIAHPAAANVVVERSTDDGLTWEKQPFLNEDRHFRFNNRRGFDRAYRVLENGWRFRVRVVGFQKQFAMWIESRN